MKILHISMGVTVGSGVDKVIYDLSRNQIAANHQVSVLALNPGFLSMKDEFERIGAKVIVGKYTHQYDLRNILLIKDVICGYDVVHAHLYPVQLFAVIAHCLLESVQKPVLVTTEHNTYNNRRKYKLFRYLDRWMYAGFDRIACISDDTEKSLNQWLKDDAIRGKVATVPNGIGIGSFVDAAPTLDNHMAVDHEKKYVVMVARMEYPKDFKTLITAISRLGNRVELILVGDGPERSALEKFAESEGVGRRVHFLGICSDVAGILKNCDIGVLSSHWDGFGLVAAEYMAAGLPAVVSDVPGLRSVVDDAELLFAVGDSCQLSAILSKLLDDGDFYNSKVEHCKKTVLEYSDIKMTEKYIRLYKNQE